MHNGRNENLMVCHLLFIPLVVETLKMRSIYSHHAVSTHEYTMTRCY